MTVGWKHHGSDMMTAKCGVSTALEPLNVRRPIRISISRKRLCILQKRDVGHSTWFLACVI
jgi:hypothetical protein